MNSLSHDLSSASFAYNTSTPNSISRPRVDFRSVESLAISACSHESHDDTGYTSMHSSALSFHDDMNKENEPKAKTTTNVQCKSRRKLSDWQIWYLNQAYVQNRYPSSSEQERIGSQLLLPTSTIRIWFQNHRARAAGKK